MSDGTTIGVEEEFFLVDRRTRLPADRATQVVRTSRDRLGAEHVAAEIARTMIETVSAVCHDGDQLSRELSRLRRGASKEAARHGCLLVASGVPPLGEGGPPPLQDDTRYRSMARRFGPLVHDQAVCACHVHVGVPDPEEAVQVVNHLRPWLPVLLALSCNSPVWRGEDTGYASWRTSVWGRWPTAGPPPYLESASHYEELVSGLTESGAALDPAMLFWFARPSRHVPTVEVRLADVMPTARETVAYALVVRALVTAALDDIRQGRPVPQVDGTLLAAACWQAAKEGVRGRALDLSGRAGASTMARRVQELRGRTEDWYHSDSERRTVSVWLDASVTHGTGADRQRAVHAALGDLALVDSLAVSTDGEETDGLSAPREVPERPSTVHFRR
ncbi:glutamate--cysteine ligase [Streptomyces sp. NPDC091272]|uniref:carboxylate-amine ligase n=1 Tax=Streptomyces sp. NPDC091272 TaxID=3365981 RepID=UPI0037FF240B